MKTASKSTLVARDEELERALHNLRFGGGVLITGQAGVGKTALAAAVAGTAWNAPAERLVEILRRVGLDHLVAVSEAEALVCLGSRRVVGKLGRQRQAVDWFTERAVLRIR